jgi:hypothetical protein
MYPNLDTTRPMSVGEISKHPLDRLMAAICGSRPTSEAAAAKAVAPEGLFENLHQAADRIAGMASSINESMARVQRSLG